MVVYIDAIGFMNFLVDFLLLLGTNRLCGYPPGWGRTASAAALGGVYAGACFVPRLAFLGNIYWRLVCLGLMAWIAFGTSKSALRRGIVFVFLSMALGGIAFCFGKGNVWSLLSSAALVSILCAVGFREKIGVRSFVPVELSYGGKCIKLTALHDTGNMLRDPVTGRGVLVVGADVATQLTGLSQHQLRSPVEAMSQTPLPGLRLIPYHALGQPAGLLLALRIQDVRIGKWKGSSLVAFAPEGLSREGTYQALTGGAA